ncbi:hypothetical protein E1B28_005152 [Marasmius oreades]|uniref:Uncharacterized protein n=1 Tax=Marasmius oreades TaxID=181124 RepID=A0A9P7V049_9AGAR|nr:uncharacterized protein E1B28_005152 [Marasmius oreades]KAG7097834.1 hypothetical protein E1B28_005152 [Marasmius oreades]
MPCISWNEGTLPGPTPETSDNLNSVSIWNLLFLNPPCPVIHFSSKTKNTCDATLRAIIHDTLLFEDRIYSSSLPSSLPFDLCRGSFFFYFLYPNHSIRISVVFEFLM